MAGAKVPLTFRIFKGDQLQREERLSLSVIKLGKVPSAHLKLDDETVSRMHAIIEVNGPGDVSIIDLGSTKGTFVNGQKVNKAKLQSGDTIVVGETRIELAIGGADEDEPTKVSHIAAPPAEVIASTPRPAPSPLAATMPAAPRVPVPPAPPLSSAPPPAPLPPSPPLPLAPPPPTFAGVPHPPVAPAPPQTFSVPQVFSAPFPPAAPPSFNPPSFSPPASVPPPAVRPPPGLPGGAPIFGTAMAPPVGFQQAMAESADDYSGARAIEVAAMLGDSVVSVKHCIDPRAGRIQGPTWLLFAIGLLSLVMSIAVFDLSYDNAKYNQAGLDAWVKGDPDHGIQPRPAYAYRPRQAPFLFDVGAVAGVIISLITLTLSGARMRQELQSPLYRIGVGEQRGNRLLSLLRLFRVLRPFIQPYRWAKVELATEGVPIPQFALIATQGSEFAFNMFPGMEGELIVGGQSTPLAEMIAQGRMIISPIPHGSKIRARVGRNTTFLVSSVPRPRRVWGSLFISLDALFAICLAATTGIVGLFALILLVLIPEDTTVNSEFATLEDTTTRTSSTSQDDPLPPPPEDKPDTGASQSGGTGTAMQLDEGKMGKKDSDRATGQYKMQKTQEDPTLARQEALDQARNAGILGSTALNQGGAFASLTGTGDLSSGFDDTDVHGGLLGNEAGEMNGGFGYGRSGFGPGGGGTGWDTIGTGRYGTIGHGAGTGEGYGVGGGRGGMRGRTAAVPSVSIGQPSSSGDLDKAIIRRYIKRNIQKIQYCYEKQLLAKPTLAGTVQSQFVITPNGTVATSTASGVDPEVSSCVAGVLKDIEFPKPKGGGIVQVNYPFIFHQTGASP